MSSIDRKTRRHSVSHLLRAIIVKHQSTGFITYGDLVHALGERAYGLIIILFALPSALPISIIPGFSFVFGLPILFIAVHLIIGKRCLWLPGRLSRQRVETKKLAMVIQKTRPILLSIERFLKQRLLLFTSKVAEHIHGLMLFVLAFLLLLPIPFSNFILSALIICFGLGLTEKDGVLLLIAYIGSVSYILFLISMTNKLYHLFA